MPPMSSPRGCRRSPGPLPLPCVRSLPPTSDGNAPPIDSIHPDRWPHQPTVEDRPIREDPAPGRNSVRSGPAPRGGTDVRTGTRSPAVPDPEIPTRGRRPPDPGRRCMALDFGGTSRRHSDQPRRAELDAPAVASDGPRQAGTPPLPPAGRGRPRRRCAHSCGGRAPPCSFPCTESHDGNRSRHDVSVSPVPNGGAPRPPQSTASWPSARRRATMPSRLVSIRPEPSRSDSACRSPTATPVKRGGRPQSCMTSSESLRTASWF